jgi:integrase
MPRAPRFTERQVAALKAGKRTHVSDTPNLYVIKIANSVNRYFYRYPRPGHVPEINPKTGKPKSPMTEAAVGKPGITLKDGKKIAAQYAQWLRDGIDPQERRNWERVETATLGQVAAMWLENNKPPNVSSLANVNNLLRHLEPLMNLTPLQISPKKIAATLRPLSLRAWPQAMRARGVIEQVFNFAKGQGIPTYMGENPARWELQKELFPKQKKTPRKHYPAMHYAEVPTFVKALRQRQGRATGAVALEFLILTCTRRSEVLEMKWSEVKPEKLWVIPAERMKAREEHRVPLSDRALELLARQKEQSTGSPYVFTGYTEAPLAEKAMIFIMRNMGVTEATVHGFRSSFRDWAGDMTLIPRETIEECLAHQVGNAVENAYRRSDALLKRRQIMEMWAQYCGSEELKLPVQNLLINP